MKTTKPISGISYNTPEFLHDVLERLLHAGRISDAFWIHHEPDVDGTKPHVHLVLFTVGSVDPFAFAKVFDEAVEGEEKPRKFKPNPDTQGKTLSVSDWLLYAVHDPFYLDCKGLSRNVHYSRDDVRCLGDGEHLQAAWASVAEPKPTREQIGIRVLDLIAKGLELTEILHELGPAIFQHPELTMLIRCLASDTPLPYPRPIVKRI